MSITNIDVCGYDFDNMNLETFKKQKRRERDKIVRMLGVIVQNQFDNYISLLYSGRYKEDSKIVKVFKVKYDVAEITYSLIKELNDKINEENEKG